MSSSSILSSNVHIAHIPWGRMFKINDDFNVCDFIRNNTNSDKKLNWIYFNLCLHAYTCILRRAGNGSNFSFPVPSRSRQTYSRPFPFPASVKCKRNKFPSLPFSRNWKKKSLCLGLKSLFLGTKIPFLAHFYGKYPCFFKNQIPVCSRSLSRQPSKIPVP